MSSLLPHGYKSFHWPSCGQLAVWPFLVCWSLHDLQPIVKWFLIQRGYPSSIYEFVRSMFIETCGDSYIQPCNIVIKHVSNLRQVDGFLRVLSFLSPKTMNLTIYLNIDENISIHPLSNVLQDHYHLIYFHISSKTFINCVYRRYHPPRSQCLDTEMVYQIYLLLKFTVPK